MKKTSILLSILSVILLSTVALRAEVINSFEDPTKGFGGEEAGVTYMYGSNIGVTDGLYSLGVVAPGPTWWSGIGSDSPSNLVDILKANSQIKVDITVPQWAGTNNWLNFIVNLNSNLGWVTLPSSGSITAGTPSTITYDYSTLDKANIQWAQLVYCVQNQNGPQPFYVDNIRAVPEPATFVLLAVGGLMLLVWRKR